MSEINSGTVVITNAGGIGVISIDNIAKTRLDLVDLSPKTKQTLKNTLPPSASVQNPIDVLGDAPADRYKSVLEILGNSGEVGSVVVILTPQIVTESLQTAQAIVDFSQKFRQIVTVAVFVGGKLIKEAKKLLQQNKIPVYDTPETAITSLNYLHEYSLYESVRFEKNQKLEALLQKDLADLNQFKISKITKQIQNQISKNLDYQTLLDMADLVDLELADSILIKPQDTQIEFKIKEFLDKHKTIVAKVVDSDILHRTERKMVRVGLKSSQEVLDFVAEFRDLQPQIALQEMVSGGLEAFIGISFDQNFGYTFVAGTGGIYAEAYKDFVLGPIPTSHQEILWYFKKTRIYKLFNGYRNKFFDQNKYTQSIYKLSLLVIVFPQIQSIDINPYIASGNGGKIVDFKVILR
jgi:acyl-CoA synthetase (NDP forming)